MRKFLDPIYFKPIIIEAIHWLVIYHRFCLNTVTTLLSFGSVSTNKIVTLDIKYNYLGYNFVANCKSDRNSNQETSSWTRFRVWVRLRDGLRVSIRVNFSVVTIISNTFRILDIGLTQNGGGGE